MTDTQIIKCTHGYVCLVNGQKSHLLHPDMTVCPDSDVPVARIEQVDPPTTLRGAGAATVVSTHYAVRDGSVWLCLHCRATRPFGQGAAAFSGECVPRRWGE